jgi:hypothetical protein
MSCYHRYPHGCDRPVVPPDYWYDAYGYRPRQRRDEYVIVREDDAWEEQRPRSRRNRRRERERPEGVSVASLRDRAEDLRAELTRIEEDLARLTAEPDDPSAV